MPEILCKFCANGENKEVCAGKTISVICPSCRIKMGEANGCRLCGERVFVCQHGVSAPVCKPCHLKHYKQCGKGISCAHCNLITFHTIYAKMGQPAKQSPAAQC